MYLCDETSDVVDHDFIFLSPSWHYLFEMEINAT